MTLVLFDIDGTLLNAHGLGRRTIEDVLSEVAGRPVRGSDVPFAGRTDPAIARDMLARAGVPDDELDLMLRAGLDRYTDLMDEACALNHVTLLPGATSVVEHLSRSADVVLGLLTGNMERTAFAKLRAAGLDRYFGFGAYGSDNPDRYALPPIALRRAAEHLGATPSADSSVIIGDTTHDVGCGRQAGMRTVAVCTGPVSAELLAAAGPDLLLPDLGDGSPLYRFLGLRPSA